MTKIESFDRERHYPWLEDWWARWHDSAPPPVNCLPDTTFFALHNDRPVAAVSIYLMNADVAQLAFPIAAPDRPSKIVIPALKMAIHAALMHARIHMRGKGFVWFQTHSPAIHKIVQQCGFTPTESCLASYLGFQADFDPDVVSP